MVGVALTCKYMGWDWETYQKQPLDFIWIINTIRMEEAKEQERLSKKHGN